MRQHKKKKLNVSAERFIEGFEVLEKCYNVKLKACTSRRRRWSYFSSSDGEFSLRNSVLDLILSDDIDADYLFWLMIHYSNIKKKTPNYEKIFKNIGFKFIDNNVNPRETS